MSFGNRILVRSHPTPPAVADGSNTGHRSNDRIPSQEAFVGMTYTIDEVLCTISAIAEGRIAFEEIRRHLEEERAAGGLSYPALIDARTAVPDLSSDDVRRIVRLLENLGRDGRLGPTAVVVASDFAYGLMRMLEILVERFCVIRPFRDFYGAAGWLRQLRKNAAR